MKCPYCNHDVPKGAENCPYCRAAVENTEKAEKSAPDKTAKSNRKFMEG